jgi:hypothetical protein
MTRFKATDSIPHNKRTHKIHMLTEEELDETGEWCDIHTKELLGPYFSESTNTLICNTHSGTTFEHLSSYKRNSA